MFALHFYCCLHLVAKRMCFSASSGKEDKKGCRQVQCVYHQHVFIKSHCKMQRTVLKTNWITNEKSNQAFDNDLWLTGMSHTTFLPSSVDMLTLQLCFAAHETLEEVMSHYHGPWSWRNFEAHPYYWEHTSKWVPCVLHVLTTQWWLFLIELHRRLLPRTVTLYIKVLVMTVN